MSQQPSPGKKVALKKPVEQIRAELLVDADTQRIAKAVNMELEAYVDLVLDYLQNPDKEPQLKVSPDEALREAGYEPPSAEDVANFFIAGARGELNIAGSGFLKSEFSEGPSTAGKPSLSGESAAKPGAAPAANPELLNQVKRGGGPSNV